MWRQLLQVQEQVRGIDWIEDLEQLGPIARVEPRDDQIDIERAETRDQGGDARVISVPYPFGQLSGGLLDVNPIHLAPLVLCNSACL
jgi:hypothetical protein